jgi:hypothetical protein
VVLGPGRRGEWPVDSTDAPEIASAVLGHAGELAEAHVAWHAQLGAGLLRGAAVQDDQAGPGVENGDLEAVVRDAEVAPEALDSLLDVDERGAEAARHLRRIGHDPLTCVARDVRTRLVHVARCECERGPEESVARDVVGEHMRRLAAAADDAGVLGAAAVDERRLDDALGVEARKVEERTVDAVHRAPSGHDLGVPVPAREVEVPKRRVVRRDQNGRARLGDAVAQARRRRARFALQPVVLLELSLVGLLENHHAQPERHERDRDDQKHELERLHTAVVGQELAQLSHAYESRARFQRGSSQRIRSGSTPLASARSIVSS